jgi:voltage-gated potassium channel
LTERFILLERPMTRFLRQPVSIRGAAGAIVTATVAIVLVGGALMRVIDHREFANIWVGMWWALQTVTTVGYGDVTPKDVAGRAVAALVMLEGIALLAIVTAAITSTFVERAQSQRAAKAEAEAEEANVRFDDLAARLERVETLLERLTRASGAAQ